VPAGRSRTISSLDIPYRREPPSELIGPVVGLTLSTAHRYARDVVDGSSNEGSILEAARRGDEHAFAQLVEPYRAELRLHCYRLGGSLHDADDLLQESLLRVWRGLSSFEGRSSFRTWIFKVTTNTCLDALEKQPPRLLPMDVSAAAAANAQRAPPRLDPAWIEPWPDSATDGALSPEARYTMRESVALAFLVALQLLPPRQRAVLLLRDVLGWQAAECAELLGLTVAAVTSALQRARETIDRRAPTLHEASRRTADEKTADLLSRYVTAWETSDVALLVSLLRDDATLAMPPLPQWVRGAMEIGASLGGMVFTPGSSGAFRLVPTRANELPAFATYKRDENTGELQSLSIQLIETADEQIVSIVAFLDASLFAPFGLPSKL